MVHACFCVRYRNEVHIQTEVVKTLKFVPTTHNHGVLPAGTVCRVLPARSMWAEHEPRLRKDQMANSWRCLGGGVVGGSGGARVASVRWRCLLGGCRGLLLGRCSSPLKGLQNYKAALTRHLPSTCCACSGSPPPPGNDEPLRAPPSAIDQPNTNHHGLTMYSVLWSPCDGLPSYVCSRQTDPHQSPHSHKSWHLCKLALMLRPRRSQACDEILPRILTRITRNRPSL